MLVALPSAVAYGIIIFTPLGNDSASRGALAGIIGAAVLGSIAPLFGGTPRLVSAPCAPAAALLSMFTAQMAAVGSVPVQIIPFYIALIACGAGLMQIMAGILKGGTFIKYIPYPVVAGYLSGVGLLIFLGQLPSFLGLPHDLKLLQGIASPGVWRWESIVIGTVTILVMLLTPKIIKSMPASIAALGSGIIVFFCIGYFNPALLTIDGNHLLVGRISASAGSISSLISGNITAAASLDIDVINSLFIPTVSLGILLSIDTLKTCMVLDVMTGSRHNSNRELLGQGIANISSSLVTGIPGSGTMGGTLVNIYSGGRTRFSGLIEGLSSLLVLVFLARFIAWIPVASLAGVLLVVAVRMLDRKSIQLLKHSSTIFDFGVIVAVVVSAVSMNLITAAGVGIAFAIVLFLREQMRFPVVRRLITGDRTFSKKNRPVSEHRILVSMGVKTVVLELQGQLFFGTTDQLYSEIEPYIGKCRYFILDMRRVLSIDFTAANMMSQLKRKIRDNCGMLILSSVPLNLPSGLNVRSYLEKLGFPRESKLVRFFPELDDALEWVEDEYLNEALPERLHRRALDLSGFEFFRGIPDQALATLSIHVSEKQFSDNNKIFSSGDTGDEIFFIRKGSVRIEIPLDTGLTHHLATIERGSFFGDMSFLENETRSADAVAIGDVELYTISRKDFGYIIEKYPDVAGKFFERLASEMSHRLRLNLVELKALEEN